MTTTNTETPKMANIIKELPAKPWWKSKTLWVAVIQGIIGILVVLISQHPELGWLMVAKSVLDSFLRYITIKPLV